MPGTLNPGFGFDHFGAIVCTPRGDASPDCGSLRKVPVYWAVQGCDLRNERLLWNFARIGSISALRRDATGSKPADFLGRLWLAPIPYGAVMSFQRVLIVDSDRTAVQRLLRLFNQLPVQIVIATSRAEALELSLRSPFALCLISHGLSDGNGLPLLRESLCRRGPVVGVLMSRHPDLRVVQQALDAGYVHVIEQPVDLQQVVPVLCRVFGDAAASLSFESDTGQRCTCMNTNLPDLRYIASLTMAQIRSSLSNSDLIQIIRSVDYPFAGKERLEYFDRDTLERVVCLVRRWSQQRLAMTPQTAESAINFAFSASTETQEHIRDSA